MNVIDIKSGLNTFNKKCLDEFKKSMDIEYTKICDKMEKEMQKNIMTMVGKDLYDYSKCGGKGNEEKVVIQFKASYCPHGVNQTMTYYDVTLTNYAKLVTTSRRIGNSACRIPLVKEHKLNFWIPIDYIYILKETLSMLPKQLSNQFNPDRILRILKHLKTNLLNGHYVKNNIDIKFTDVYKKEQQLIKREEQFKKQKKEQGLEIKKLYEHIKKEKDELKKQKNKFKLIAQKIKMENIKLNTKKKEFERQMLKHVDIDNLIDDMEL